MIRKLSVVAAVVAACAPIATRPAHGADFRVENTVTAGSDPSPVSRTTTLFYEGRAYDFSADARRVAVFELGAQRVFELDMDRKVQVEIDRQAIESTMRQLRAMRGPDSSAMLRFLLAPQFDQKWKADAEELTLDSDFLTYRVATHSPPAETVDSLTAYLSFSNIAARIAPMLDARAPAPFARLKLNEALSEVDRLPKEVELIRVVGRGKERVRVTLRAKHEFRWQLSDADRAMIQEVQRNRLRFAAVNLDEFRKTPVAGDKNRDRLPR